MKPSRLGQPKTWELLKPKARQMRHEPTEAEYALWQRLRNKQVEGCRFRRQHPIGRFIVDFYCASINMVIEIDGAVHNSRSDEDQIRTDYLVTLGVKLIRFTNDKVLNNIDDVVKKIRQHLSVE